MNIIIIAIYHLIYLAIHCVQCKLQYVVIANSVLCVFQRERTLEVQATYRRCFSIPVESILLLLGSSNEGIVVRRSSIFTVAPRQVHPSPIFSVAPSMSVVPNYIVAPSTVALFKDLYSVAPSTSVAPIVTVALLQLHRSTVLLLLLAAILCHVIICYSTILYYQQLCYRCEYALSTI